MTEEIMGGGDSLPLGGGSIVRETGLAVVHKNERIVPAPGSAAQIASVTTAAGVVEYRFPVEIVVVGALGDAERRRLEAGIWERLADALARLA